MKHPVFNFHDLFGKPVWLILAIALINNPLQGQFKTTPVQKSNNQIILQGKPYLLHEIVQGHTLYSIAKAYEVTEEEILAANPQLAGKPLKPGIVIRIPDKMTASNDISQLDNRTYIYHDVKPKETLFSLSRQYGVKMDDIKTANPEIRWGLKAGMTIRIPKEKITIAQTGANQSENKNPREDAGLNLGWNQPCREKPVPHVDYRFNIAIMLPLNITENSAIEWTPEIVRETPEFFRFFEFLEGAYLAIDSLRQAGLSMDLQVFDTEKDPERVKEIISSGKLNNVNLIIGPVYPKELEIAAIYAKSRAIPLVSPLSSFQDILTDNPYVFQVNNTPERQELLTTRFIGLNTDKNIVIINSSLQKDDESYLQFLSMVNEQLKENDKSRNVKVLFFDDASRSVLNSDLSKTRIEDHLSKTKTNLVIIPSEEEVMVSEMVNQLNKKSVDFDLTVFGMPEWTDISGIDIDFLYNINLQIYGTFTYPHVDFSDLQVLDFCSKYRYNWNNEPSRFSFQGFDVTYYFSKALFYFGKDLISTVPCWDDYLDNTSIQTPFSFSPIQTGYGYENQALTIIRYNKEELRKERMHVLLRNPKTLR